MPTLGCRALKKRGRNIEMYYPKLPMMTSLAQNADLHILPKVSVIDLREGCCQHL